MDNSMLAIDDDPALLEGIAKAAAAAGVASVTLTNLAAFKAAVTAQPPGIILIALQMRDCDGIELLRFLADVQCRARIVLMSRFDGRLLNHATSVGREFGLEMGHPLQKPIDPEQLRQLFARMRSKSFKPDAGALREALEEDRLELHYHPLVDLRSGRTVGLEALARWNHADYGMIMPDRFIAIAEREGLIDPLTERVIALAVRQLGAWRKEGFDAFVSVNVSAANIADPRLPDRLARLCADHAVPTSEICLELTETAAMGNPALMLEVLTRLRLKGFRLAIDDFGTGYSSLLQLHRLPFSELKIDQSFVRAMERSEEARTIVAAVAGLGKGLGLDLIAEGVESQELLRRLAGYGCEIGQGYHFSRPMPAAQVLDWMASGPPGTSAAAA